MIEIIAAVAGLLGISVKDLTKAVKTVSERKAKEKIDKRREQEALFANQKAVTSLVNEYYGSSSTSDLKRYHALIDGIPLNTTIHTSEKYLSVFNDPREMTTSLLSSTIDSTKHKKITEAVSGYAPEVIARLETMGVKIWNDPLYRLLSIDNTENTSSFGFGLTDFLSYRFTSGILADEITDALIAAEGSSEKILLNPQSNLPIRQVIMPELKFLSNYQSRICAGGIGVLLAIARGKPHNDFLLTFQVRSSFVSDGRNQLAVLPKAFHQPIADSDEEISLYSTLQRELFEEVYGHPDVEHQSHRLKHNWYLDEEPGVAYLDDHVGGYTLEVTGFGLNAIAGNFDFGLLLAIRDEWYWNTFGNKLFPNWEASKLMRVSSKDTAGIKDILLNYSWANESIPHVLEGLLRLKEIEPKRVSLPDIQRVLMS